ncbi:MAG: carbohydrate kinase [Deltaproteobacteria bacterium]|nr:carbohydrate kinase [Deltaproteobacteria bacterium]
MAKHTKKQHILAVDVGTSEVKVALVSHQGVVTQHARRSLPVLHPKPTWAEQDPNAWWNSICAASRELWQSPENNPESVTGLVFSCQMFGVLPVDGDGKPLMNAMIWLDTRSRDQAREITAGFPKIAGYGLPRLIKWLRTTNGAPNLAGRDTISKFIWLREKRPHIWKRTHKLLDVKDYLLMRCTGRTVTTYDLASGGWLFNTRKGELGWSKKILKMLKLDTDRLPTVIRSTEVAGFLLDDAAGDLGIPSSTPVVAGAGDVPSCAVGSGAVRDGEVHICLGTSSWVATHMNNRAVNPMAATGTLCAAEFGKYILIATQETAGASMEWLRKQILGEDLDYEKINQLVAECAPGAGGVFFFPWMMGERVPVDDSSIRGGFVNLALDHERSHLLRAVFEGVAYNNKWALGVVEKLRGGPVSKIRITGGGAQGDAWCQIMADVLGVTVERADNPQFSGARGAALIALRALGEVAQLEDTGDLVQVTDVFQPNPELQDFYQSRYKSFLDYYKRNHSWFRRLNEGRKRK